MDRPLARRFFSRSAAVVARDLIGRRLIHRGPKGSCAGIIVETEAYDETEAASHCFIGPTERNRVMFGPAGYCYVYRSYGIHWCANVVAGRNGFGAAVLLRALQPIEGLAPMARRRGPKITELDLARGPGRLCQAMGITLEHYGTDLTDASSKLIVTNTVGRFVRPPIKTTGRIGISKAKSLRWRFCAAGSPYVSGPSALR